MTSEMNSKMEDINKGMRKGIYRKLKLLIKGEEMKKRNDYKRNKEKEKQDQ